MGVNLLAFVGKLDPFISVDNLFRELENGPPFGCVFISYEGKLEKRP